MVSRYRRTTVLPLQANLTSSHIFTANRAVAKAAAHQIFHKRRQSVSPWGLALRAERPEPQQSQSEILVFWIALPDDRATILAGVLMLFDEHAEMAPEIDQSSANARRGPCRLPRQSPDPQSQAHLEMVRGWREQS